MLISIHLVFAEGSWSDRMLATITCLFRTEKLDLACETFDRSLVQRTGCLRQATQNFKGGPMLARVL
jgi:hypothetical protein